MNLNLFGLLFAGIAGVFLLVGSLMARRQARRLKTFTAVPAVVVSSEVSQSTDSDGDVTYSPNIRFAYRVGGQNFESTTPLPMGTMSASGTWAQRIVDRYPAGKMTQGYVDPADPSKAFLVREASFFPYLFILFPMIHFAVGLAVLLGGGEPPLCSARMTAFYTAMVWNVAGIACYLHYRFAGGEMKLWTQVVFILYGGMGLIGLVVSSSLSNEFPKPGQPEVIATQPADPPDVEAP